MMRMPSHDPVPALSRRLAIAVVLSLAMLATPDAVPQSAPGTLPDMGSSAGTLITPAQERIFGERTRRQLRQFGLLLEDPLLDEWLQDMAHALVAASDKPQQDFTFFLVKSQQINAFATLGGYIGLNAGLAMAAEYEDEVAAVLAHEIAHVTQRHILRQVEQTQQDAIPIMLGMLAAIVAGAGSGSGDAVQAAILGGQGLMIQRQINHTRASEHEADRLGIQTLARAGYNPEAMADFFGRAFRTTNPYGFPDFLRTHPVTTTRISEARDRARQIQGRSGHGASGGTVCINESDGREITCEWNLGDDFLPSPSKGPPHPLLTEELSPRLEDIADRRGPDPERFAWVRERMRVYSAGSPAASIAEYSRIEREFGERLDSAQRYGYALALLQDGRAADALTLFRDLAEQRPDDLWAALALAESELRSGLVGQALARYEGLNAALPKNRAVILSHAESLIHLQDPDAARRAQSVMRPLLDKAGNDPDYQRLFARASEIAGDNIRASEAHAEVALLTGRAEDALQQFHALLARDDLDYITRSRIDARIAQVMPFILEMRRQGTGQGGRNAPRG